MQQSARLRTTWTACYSAIRAQPVRIMAQAVLNPAGVQIVKESDLHLSKPTSWLESRFHFSFADWHDSQRQGWGALRVVNDDLVSPHAGFGMHPHRDMEIFTYVVSGSLSHKDSMGNRESLHRGCVQYLSAGTGITHSEMNDGEETCRFLQIWINPDKRGHTPQYGSSMYTSADRKNRLLQILGGTSGVPSWLNVHNPHAIRLHQDANVFVSELNSGHSMDLELGAGRQVYLIVIEGGLVVNGLSLGMREAAKIEGNKLRRSALKLESFGP